MLSIGQEGALTCNRVGHDFRPIEAVCMKKECQEPIPCCITCMTNEHRNHQQQEFVQISDVKGQDNSFLDQLIELAELSQSISDVCQSWKKEILKMIDQQRQSRQLSQNPTLTELSDYVRRAREIDAPQREIEVIQKFKNEFQQIRERLRNIQKEASDLLNQQVDVYHKVNQQNVMEQEVKKFNSFRFTLTQQLKGHNKEVGYISISNDDNYIASSSYPETVILWDLKSNKKLTQYNSRLSQITALQFSKDNSMLGVCSWDYENDRSWVGFIEIFDLTNLKNTQAKIRLEGHQNSICRIIFTEDSNHLISVSDDASLRIWDLKQRKINQQNCEYDHNGVAYSQKQKLIACCDYKGYAHLFDCRKLIKLKIKWQAHSDSCKCIEFIKNSTVLMTSSLSETRFWLVDDLLREKFTHFKEIKDGGWTLKAHPVDNPQVIINCSQDNNFVNLWDYNSTALIQRLEVPKKLIQQSFAITSDYTKIITGGKNEMVNIFV